MSTTEQPADRVEIFENVLDADPAPKHYPGIPRQWKVTLTSGQQLLVRFTDETETDIEVAYRGNEWSRWSPATPGVPA